MIDRYTVWNASGNVSQRDLDLRDEFYDVTAPITTSGYADLADAVQKPGTNEAVIDTCTQSVASEIAEASHMHDESVVQARLAHSVKRAIEQRNYR